MNLRLLTSKLTLGILTLLLFQRTASATPLYWEYRMPLLNRYGNVLSLSTFENIEERLVVSKRNQPSVTLMALTFEQERENLRGVWGHQMLLNLGPGVRKEEAWRGCFYYSSNGPRLSITLPIGSPTDIWSKQRVETEVGFNPIKLPSGIKVGGTLHLRPCLNPIALTAPITTITSISLKRMLLIVYSPLASPEGFAYPPFSFCFIYALSTDFEPCLRHLKHLAPLPNPPTLHEEGISPPYQGHHGLKAGAPSRTDCGPTCEEQNGDPDKSSERIQRAANPPKEPLEEVFSNQPLIPMPSIPPEVKAPTLQEPKSTTYFPVHHEEGATSVASSASMPPQQADQATALPAVQPTAGELEEEQGRMAQAPCLNSFASEGHLAPEALSKARPPLTACLPTVSTETPACPEKTFPIEEEACFTSEARLTHFEPRLPPYDFDEEGLSFEEGFYPKLIERERFSSGRAMTLDHACPAPELYFPDLRSLKSAYERSQLRKKRTTGPLRWCKKALKNPLTSCLLASTLIASNTPSLRKETSHLPTLQTFHETPGNHSPVILQALDQPPALWESSSTRFTETWEGEDAPAHYDEPPFLGIEEALYEEFAPERFAGTEGLMALNAIGILPGLFEAPPSMAQGSLAYLDQGISVIHPLSSFSFPALNQIPEGAIVAREVAQPADRTRLELKGALLPGAAVASTLNPASGNSILMPERPHPSYPPTSEAEKERRPGVKKAGLTPLGPPSAYLSPSLCNASELPLEAIPRHELIGMGGSFAIETLGPLPRAPRPDLLLPAPWPAQTSPTRAPFQSMQPTEKGTRPQKSFKKAAAQYGFLAGFLPKPKALELIRPVSRYLRHNAPIYGTSDEGGPVMPQSIDPSSEPRKEGSLLLAAWAKLHAFYSQKLKQNRGITRIDQAISLGRTPQGIPNLSRQGRAKSPPRMESKFLWLLLGTAFGRYTPIFLQRRQAEDSSTKPEKLEPKQCRVLPHPAPSPIPLACRERSWSLPAILPANGKISITERDSNEELNVTPIRTTPTPSSTPLGPYSSGASTTATSQASPGIREGTGTPLINFSRRARTRKYTPLDPYSSNAGTPTFESAQTPEKLVKTPRFSKTLPEEKRIPKQGFPALLNLSLTEVNEPLTDAGPASPTGEPHSWHRTPTSQNMTLCEGIDRLEVEPFTIGLPIRDTACQTFRYILSPCERIFQKSLGGGLIPFIASILVPLVD